MILIYNNRYRILRYANKYKKYTLLLSNYAVLWIYDKSIACGKDTGILLFYYITNVNGSYLTI